MLNLLTIQNVALIDRAEIEFSHGLNVLSGETGAGKSVILDSIDFVLGAKADKSMIRYGADEATVRAEFFVGDRQDLRELLTDLDVEWEDTLIITRKLSRDGRSSLKLNGCSLTASMLRKVSGMLVDVHGQSEHFFLLKESNQLHLLDTLSPEITQKKQEISLICKERREILEQLKTLGGDEGERNRRIDVLRYQIDELSRADLKEGEEEELICARNRFMNAERILTGLASARDMLLADGAGSDLVNGAQRALSSIAKYDETYAQLLERLENLSAELNDVAECVNDEMSVLDMDEAEAERVENRLDEIKTLKKKYGGTVEKALEFLERAQAELDLLSDSGERYEKLVKSLQKIEGKLFDECLLLSVLRKETATGFTARVVAELKTLNINSAKFEVEFDGFSREDVAKASENGLDSVRFLFSANAGEPLKELGKIISGGEMSRFMLAIKAQLSSINEIETYLFDEIDAGIGGKTARVVAEKFCRIAKDVQVIAVSHLAQIAAFADREFLIEKREENGKTYSFVRQVEGKEREMEIARLVSGEQGEFALKHAKELLQNAEIYKKSLS